MSWEDCGIDHLVIDEAHAFKTSLSRPVWSASPGFLRVTVAAVPMTAMSSASTFLSMGPSNSALGTPLTNTICEAFVWLRMLQPKLLEHVGLTSFDSFASVFTEAYPSVELDCVGKYRTQTRFALPQRPRAAKLQLFVSEAWDFVREPRTPGITL